MQKLTDLNPPREDGFPAIKEISGKGTPMVTDPKDPVFLKPLRDLYKERSQSKGVLIFKIIHNG